MQFNKEACCYEKSFDPRRVEKVNERYMPRHVFDNPREGVITTNNCLALHITIACGYLLANIYFLSCHHEVHVGLSTGVAGKYHIDLIFKTQLLYSLKLR